MKKKADIKLTQREKRAVIEKLLKGSYFDSDRQLAKQVPCDHKTVGTVRRTMVQLGAIPAINKTVDTLGRKQPYRKTAIRHLDIERLLNTINHADCLEMLRRMPDECVDLIITSPPYNLGTHKNRKGYFNPYDDNMPEEKYQAWQIAVLNECYRILKPNGSLWYNHKNRLKKGVQISPYQWLFKTKFTIKQEIVWETGTRCFDKIRFYPFTERVYWLTKSPKTKMFNAISHTDIFTRRDWKPVGTKGEHKRAFPVQMAKDIISCFDDAKVILDPFSGSGTVAVAAKELGRSYIGIEKSKEYYRHSINRLNPQNITVSYEKQLIKPNNLYNMTCQQGIELMRQQGIKADCLITSPYYNVDLEYDIHKDNKPYWEYIADLKEIFKNAQDVLNVGASVCINIGDGNNGAIPTHSDIIQFMTRELDYVQRATIIWDKSHTKKRTAWGSWQSPSCPSFPTPFEYILVFRYMHEKHQGNKADITVTPDEFKDNSLALWRIKPETQANEIGHPAPFPIEIPHRLIQQLTYKNDLVLDIFSGSGTTALAARNLDRKYIGFELSEAYHKIAQNRLFKGRKVA